MIISASVRTDLPAFYGAWFLNRLEAGYCLTRNPFRPGQVSRVSLAEGDVDGFVFWTRNVEPFVPALETVAARGLPFVVQFTLNGYPRALEARVIDAERGVAQLSALSSRFGPRAAVWRYDTIVHTSLTPPSYHRENFARLAGALAGVTDEVVVSFAQIYAKTRRNLDRAAAEHDFTWGDPDAAEKQALLTELASIAASHGFRMTLCGQPSLRVDGVTAAHCVDARRLSELGGGAIAAKVKGNRPGCECYAARDIGAYDTCPHGCVYCYAVRNRDAAVERHRRHDPESPFLFSPSQA